MVVTDSLTESPLTDLALIRAITIALSVPVAALLERYTRAQRVAYEVVHLEARLDHKSGRFRPVGAVQLPGNPAGSRLPCAYLLSRSSGTV